MEKIEIGYSPIWISGNLAHHKFIFYTRSDGATFQIHGRGSRDYGLSLFEELASRGPNDLIGFGHLTTRVFRSSGKNETAALNAQREMVFEGEDLSRTFFKLAGMAQGIAEQETKYNATSNNSNTLVDRIVQWSGGRAPHMGKRYLSPGSVSSEEFKPEFYSKMPPVLCGEETYSKHRDVVDDLFREPLGEATQAEANDRIGEVDWIATESNIRKRHTKDKRLAAGIISDLANAKTLRGAWEDDFRDKYGDYLILKSTSDGSRATWINHGRLNEADVQKRTAIPHKLAFQKDLAVGRENRVGSRNKDIHGVALRDLNKEVERFDADEDLGGELVPRPKSLPSAVSGSRSNKTNDESGVIRIPAPRMKPDQRAFLTPLGANPFNLDNPKLQQQAEMLERNPVMEKRMILAADRDPKLFGLA